MDKETLSNYGWIVIAVLVLAVMIALASPFGQFIEAGVKSTAQGLFDVNQSAGAIAGLDIPDQEFCTHPETEIRYTTANYTGDTCCKLCNKVLSTGTYSVPDGGTYYVGVTSTTTGDYTGATATYTTGQELPSTVNDGDVYVYGDYEYRYNQYHKSVSVGWQINNTQNGWGVRVLDDTKTTYGAILESINGEPVTNMYYTFRECASLVTAPAIPSSVTDMTYTFYGCTKLTTAPEIPSSVTNMYYTFRECASLVTAPAIPSSVTDMTYTFYGCTKLTTAPEIPSSVTNMRYTFQQCTKLTTAPEIPSSVTDMTCTFYGCTSLTTAPTLPSSVMDMSFTFQGCTSLKTYVGSTDADGDFSGYVIPSSVTNMRYTFEGCTKLTTAPEIPSSVTDMTCTFYGCKSLTTAPVIPNSVTTMGSTFTGCTSLTGIVSIPCTATTNSYTIKNTSATLETYHYTNCGH